ncbi:MAG TPA: ABC transporter substrate-binding protein [Acidimicrobiia bacterium]|nr:ABC transporter substrate-binding protein [Acidimicrobiia bacterium]
MAALYRRLALVVSVALLLLVAVACGGDGGEAPATTADDASATTVGGAEETTVATDEPADTTAPADTSEEPTGELTQVTFAPTAPLPIYWPYYYIADPLGFYEDEGIDIEFANVQTAVQQSLLAGRLTFSGTGLDYIPQAPTLDDPPKWFMNVDRYLWVMVTLADSEFQTAADLRGGNIGINAPHDSLDANFLMGAAGVPQGEYELIPVGEDLPAMVQLEEGAIDAFVTAGAVSVAAIRDFSDTEIRIIENEAAESFYNVGSMLTLDQLENDRDLAVRFGRAVARGMVWTWENPEATGRLVFEMFPESAEDEEQAIRLIEAGNEANRASYDARGAMELEVYQQMVDQHADQELIDESYDASILFTNDLIEDIWDFDLEAEAEAARNYEG